MTAQQLLIKNNLSNLPHIVFDSDYEGDLIVGYLGNHDEHFIVFPNGECSYSNMQTGQLTHHDTFPYEKIKNRVAS